MKHRKHPDNGDAVAILHDPGNQKPYVSQEKQHKILPHYPES